MNCACCSVASGAALVSGAARPVLNAVIGGEICSAACPAAIRAGGREPSDGSSSRRMASSNRLTTFPGTFAGARCNQRDSATCDERGARHEPRETLGLRHGASGIKATTIPWNDSIRGAGSTRATPNAHPMQGTFTTLCLSDDFASRSAARKSVSIAGHRRAHESSPPASLGQIGQLPPFNGEKRIVGITEPEGPA